MIDYFTGHGFIENSAACVKQIGKCHRIDVIHKHFNSQFQPSCTW